MTDLTLNESRRGDAAPALPDDARLGGRARIAAWAMQLVAAAVLALTLPFKYTGRPRRPYASSTPSAPARRGAWGRR